MKESLYYITDTYGSNYALNAANKLVPVAKIEQAGKFTLAKANNIIQNSVKPMQRYQFILKEVADTGNDDMDTDWIGTMSEIIEFSSQLKQYRMNLNHMLSEVDKEICDIMHFIEFNNLDAAKGYKMYKMIRDCRIRRRKIRDEHEKVNAAIQVFANEELIEKMRTVLKQMKGLDNRIYSPRVLTELFEEAS